MKQKRTYKGTTRRLATDTHCANNHPWTPETTYYPANGQRKVCRVCQRNAQQRYHERVETEGPMQPANGAKTHCPAQHPYAKFGRVKSDGSRYCSICFRVNWIRRNYGVSAARWDELVLAQEGRCAICEREVGGDLHVDHDHACCPGKSSCGACVRALLCGNCNHGLGKLKDDPALLRAAAAYIERHAVGSSSHA